MSALAAPDLMETIDRLCGRAARQGLRQTGPGRHMADLVHRQFRRLSSSVLAFSRADLSADDQRELAQTLRALETTFTVEGQPLDLLVRIGSASQDTASASGDALIERATTALNHAGQSEDRTVVYDDATFVDPDNNLALMSELRDALRAGDVMCGAPSRRNTRPSKIWIPKLGRNLRVAVSRDSRAGRSIPLFSRLMFPPC